MPRTCVNDPDTFCYVCEDLTPLVEKVMNYVLVVKLGIKIGTGPLISAVRPM